jgi:uncharacterized damage-inducible protein DinB
MAWANQEVISGLQKLPDETLGLYIENPEWTVAEIARHIACSASWYGFRLMDKSGFSDSDHAAWQTKLDEMEIQPKSMSDISTVLEWAKAADARLIEEAAKPEGSIERQVDGKTIIRARSSVISQSIHHATEHRAQLVAILEKHGITEINLDDFDLWAYCDKYGEFS